MSNHSTNGASRFGTVSTSWIRQLQVAVAIGALGIITTTLPARAHPQTRQGFFLGIGLAAGTADVAGGSQGSSESGSGGNFRLGYAINPKFAIGFEGNSWVHTNAAGAGQLGTFTGAVSFFPVEGLVLRGGIGGGNSAGVGDGVSGEVGTGWTLGAGYEFRVMRTFAIGPQIDYNHVSLSNADFTFTNIGLAMTWYFIPK
jgi:hypothetical protein